MCLLIRHGIELFLRPGGPTAATFTHGGAHPGRRAEQHADLFGGAAVLALACTRHGASPVRILLGQCLVHHLVAPAHADHVVWHRTGTE